MGGGGRSGQAPCGVGEGQPEVRHIACTFLPVILLLNLSAPPPDPFILRPSLPLSTRLAEVDDKLKQTTASYKFCRRLNRNLHKELETLQQELKTLQQEATFR